MQFYYFPGDTQILVAEIKTVEEFNLLSQNVGTIYTELVRKQYLDHANTVISAIKHFSASTKNFCLALVPNPAFNHEQATNKLVTTAIEKGCQLMFTVDIKDNKVSIAQLLGPLSVAHLKQYYS